MTIPKPSPSLFPVRYTPLNEVTEPVTKLNNPKSAKRHNSPTAKTRKPARKVQK